jgi:hypothetical protein
MISTLLLLAAVEAAPEAAAKDASTPTTDIVVVAKKRKCRVQLGDAILSDRELDDYATQWAQGQEVRVHVPSTASYRCLAQIMFKLGHRGVTRAVFLDERTDP